LIARAGSRSIVLAFGLLLVPARVDAQPAARARSRVLIRADRVIE
jgi:hypothetical protein